MSQEARRELTWVECPRDSWQGLGGTLSTGAKRGHLQALLDAGFTHLDLGSFVSPKAVPQLADTEAVLAGLRVPPGGSVDLLTIIGNERGLTRALTAKEVTSVGYPLSVNDTFQLRNVGRSVSDSWPLVERLLAGAEAGGLSLVVYLSMGFGNPYGEPWEPSDTAAAVLQLREIGVKRISLADTVGNADAARVKAVLTALPEPELLGLHLHSRPGAWRAPLEAALGFGLTWFEGALGGVGGCPFAGDALVGNLPTEEVVPYLAEAGLEGPVDIGLLPELADRARALAAAAAGASP